jgi:hypothetical protein
MSVGTGSLFLREKGKAERRHGPCNHMKIQDLTPHRRVPAHLLCKGHNCDLVYGITAVGSSRNAFCNQKALSNDSQHDADGMFRRSCERHALGRVGRQYARRNATGVYKGPSSRKEKAL